MQFNWEEEAKREQILLRAALVGANGSGKTLGALKIAAGFAGPEGRIAVIDTEKKRAKLYADKFRFAHLPLLEPDHKPETMLAAARDAADRADVVIIDTISHEWLEVLTEVDRFGDWKAVTPRHREFIEGITAIPAHLIVTMRAKVKYEVLEEDVPGRTKKRQVINRLGVGPVQREGVEYEFDILAYLDSEHMATFANRCEALVGTTREIDDETVALMKAWVETGDVALPPQRIVTLENIPVPRSWAAIEEAARAYSEATWEDFRVFLGQAREHLYPGVAADALKKGQKDTLFQKAAGVMVKLLENHDPNEFPPPVRVEFQMHWATQLEGQVLEGPPWSMSPDESETHPSRTEPQPAPGSGEEAGTSTPPAEEAARSQPPSPEQTFTDTPLSDNEQAVLDAIGEEFSGPPQVPTTPDDLETLAKAPAVETGTARPEPAEA